jgi:hypothetical protein
MRLIGLGDFAPLIASEGVVDASDRDVERAPRFMMSPDGREDRVDFETGAWATAGMTASADALANRLSAARRNLWPSAGAAPPAAETGCFEMGCFQHRYVRNLRSYSLPQEFLI